MGTAAPWLLKLSALSSDPDSVTPDPAPLPDQQVAMATVLPLMTPARPRSARPAPASDVADIEVPTQSPPEGDELSRAVGVLQRRAGDSGADLPSRLGRAAWRAETLLATGPTAVDPSTADPAATIATGQAVLKATTALFDLIGEEALVLGEVLCVDLNTLGIDALSEVAEAVVALNKAPRAASRWGNAAAAEAAEMVLHVAADDLRAAARSYEELSQRFTDGIWHVPGNIVQAGRHRWHPIARERVRRELRAVSRSSRIRGLNRVLGEIVEARATRDRLAAMAPLFSHHLAELDRGPFTNVDTALAAVGAARRLQASLGPLLTDDRLEQLLLADAFRCPDVVGPAIRLGNALRAWSSDMRILGGAEACGLSQDELAHWISEVADLLPSLTESLEAAVELKVPIPTLRDLVEILLLREHLEDLMLEEPSQGDAHHVGSAS